MVYQQKYSAINTDELKDKGFYAVQFTSMAYIVQYSIEVNGDKITEVT